MRPGEDRTDEELYSRFLTTGDSDSFGLLYQRIHEGLFAYVYSRLQNVHNTQDVLQEIMLFMLQEAPSKYDARQPLFPWLVGVARLFVLKFERLQKRKGLQGMADLSQLEETLPERGKPGTLELVLRREQKEAIAGAIDTLAPKLAATVRTVVLNGMSYKEAGDIMGIAELAVAQRLHRARIILRALLTRY